MNIVKYCAAAVLAISIAAACNVTVESSQVQETTEVKTIQKTFTFSLGDNTKVSIGEEGKLKWEAGDELSLVNGDTNRKITLKASDISADGKSATVTMDIESDGQKYFALYPYSPTAREEYDILLFNGIAASQDGTFESAYKAVGQPSANSSSFTFANAFNYIKFNVSTSSIDHVVFAGNDSEPLTGWFYAMEDYIEFDNQEEAGIRIEAKVVKDGETYVALPQSSVFSKGFSIFCYTSDGSLYGIVRTSKELTLDDNTIVDLGALEDHIEVETEPVYALPYEEDFSNTKGDFTINNVTLPSASKYVWATTSSYGMKGSCYISGKAYAAESWLISPWFDICCADAAGLSFVHACNKFSGATPSDYMSVKVTTDGETWEDLTVPTWPAGTDWNFKDSGTISLDAYLGNKVKIAFVYTSTTSVCGTWEVKDFYIDATQNEPAGDDGESFLLSTEPGIYVYKTGAKDAVYDEFTCQTLVRKGTSTDSFAILNPSAGGYVLITGIPQDPAKGDTATVNISGNMTSYSGSHTVTVAMVDEDRIWLSSTSGPGIIVLKK